ncbi:MAG: hypothetical protein E6I87_04445 [Chloroflexi bacterium]|nr:MAG: hypothetical protein E6I87_04445 [Chloroflexota bacterium]
MERQGGTVVGLILIAAGVIFLIGQLANFDVGRYGWPLFVIVPGVLLLVAGIAAGRGPSAALVIPGTIVTTVGLVLLYQNATDDWESWAYAWALVGPTASGVGVALMGALQGSPTQIRRGLNTAGVGFAMFLGFAAFFEGVLHISGRDFGPVASVGFPLVLVVLGVLLLVGRLRPA